MCRVSRPGGVADGDEDVYLRGALARPDRSFSWVAFGFKAIATLLMVGTPLASVWLASSLAAFANRATWLPVAAGLLLFPGLPLAWDGIAELRARKDKGKRRFLTFFDRIVLRTLAINLLFLVVLLALFPSRAFVALSTRGDWMLDGHHGPTAERTRRVLLGCAGAVEWLYRASNDNPYREAKDDDDAKKVDPTPVPTGSSGSSGGTSPIGSATPAASASGAAPVDDRPENTTEPTRAEPTRAEPNARRYPWPAEIHPVVANMPREAEGSIASVGKYIAEREADPMLRVKALHDWVVDRIAYDVPAYVARNVPDHDRDPNHVFRTRVGVCAGYARLLTELGKATGDEILYLTGDARSRESPMEGEPHAWNAARIGGTWYLIDATWDAGHPNDGVFEKHYSTEYLFAPPELFVNSHFPDQDKWQLLERPLSRAEFFRRPVVTPAFVAYGLELVSPDRSQVSTGSSLELVVDNPRSVFILATFEPRSAPQGNMRTDCTTSSQARQVRARCEFPATGTYDVHLFANDKEAGTYAHVASVQANANPSR